MDKTSFSIMSDQVCAVPGCKSRIKANVRDRKTKRVGLKCYKHYQAAERVRRNKRS
jgi:hypothetical protein